MLDGMPEPDGKVACEMAPGDPKAAEGVAGRIGGDVMAEARSAICAVCDGSSVTTSLQDEVNSVGRSRHCAAPDRTHNGVSPFPVTACGSAPSVRRKESSGDVETSAA